VARLTGHAPSLSDSFFFGSTIPPSILARADEMIE